MSDYQYLKYPRNMNVGMIYDTTRWSIIRDNIIFGECKRAMIVGDGIYIGNFDHMYLRLDMILDLK